MTRSLVLGDPVVSLGPQTLIGDGGRQRQGDGAHVAQVPGPELEMERVSVLRPRTGGDDDDVIFSRPTKKAAKRQQKATDISCPKKLKIAASTRCRRTR